MMKIVLSSLLTLAFAASTAKGAPLPQQYGRIVLDNHSKRAGLAPAVFDHWVHRSEFTCRLCHVDLLFAMKAGATNISAAMNQKGLYCGACHNGKRLLNGKPIFASCSGTSAARPGCDLCHCRKKNSASDQRFTAFAAKMPKTSSGSGIDWEKAESSRLIKPVDVLEGVSVQRRQLKAQKDFSIEAKVAGVSAIVFSHKKHTVWTGCDVCHPDIFPIVKGSVKYTMSDIKKGDYCGVCHDKVAFPVTECKMCHAGKKK